MSGFAPLAFNIHTFLRSSTITIADVDLATASRIAELVTAVPSKFLAPELPPMSTLLQILAIAEWRHARVHVEGSRTAAEAICLFYDELCDASASREDFAALIETREILPRVYSVQVEP